MFDLRLIAAVATVIGFLAIETRMINSVIFTTALILPLLWINRGILLPWLFDSHEAERKKRNDWWMQAYREERVGKRPTSILRRTSSCSSTSTSNHNNAENEKEISIIENRRDQEMMNSSSIISNDEEMIGWNREKKVVKHVRFKAPLTTTLSAFPTLFGEESDYRFMMKNQKTCHYFEQLSRN